MNKKEVLYRDRIVDCLEQHGNMPKSKIAVLCRMNQYTTTVILKDLEAEGVVKQVTSQTNYSLVRRKDSVMVQKLNMEDKQNGNDR